MPGLVAQWNEQETLNLLVEGSTPSQPSPVTPKITPEIAARLAEEGRRLSTELRKRLKRMHTIPVVERLTPSD